MPVALPNKQFLLQLLYLAGLSTAEIAERLGISRKSVRTAIKSELFQAQVEKLQREMATSTVEKLIDRIEREAGPSLDVILSVRDGAFDDPRVAKVRYDAAKFVLGELHMDRKHPRMTREVGSDRGETRIIFTTEALKQMFGAVAEQSASAIEIDTDQPLSVPAVPPATVDPLTIDEAIQRATERDAT